MKNATIKSCMVFLILALFAPLTLADDASASATIAGILVDLNHFPSAQEKEALQGIINDDSVSEDLKAVAQAVHDIQHAASDAAKESLNAIAAKSDVDMTVKSLAEIVVGINHMPSADAKAQLQAIL